MNRIKFLRKQNNLSMDKLAKEIGVAKSSISNWEKETAQPRKKVLIKLSDFFNVTEDYLLGYSSNESPKLDWDSVSEYLSILSDFDYKKMIEVVNNKREE